MLSYCFKLCRSRLYFTWHTVSILLFCPFQKIFDPVFLSAPAKFKYFEKAFLGKLTHLVKVCATKEENGITKTTTNKGNPAIIFDGYLFWKHQISKKNEMTWRCNVRTGKTSVKTDLDIKHILNMKTEHITLSRRLCFIQ